MLRDHPWWGSGNQVQGKHFCSSPSPSSPFLNKGWRLTGLRQTLCTQKTRFTPQLSGPARRGLEQPTERGAAWMRLKNQRRRENNLLGVGTSQAVLRALGTTPSWAGWFKAWDPQPQLCRLVQCLGPRTCVHSTVLRAPRRPQQCPR